MKLLEEATRRAMRDRSIHFERAIHEAGHYATARTIKQRFPARLRRVHIRKVTVVQEGPIGGHVDARFTWRQARVSGFKVEDLPLSGKEPLAIHLFGGVASETIHNYLFGIHKVDESVEDLGPGYQEILENAATILNHCGGVKDFKEVQSLIGQDTETWKPYFWAAVGIVHRSWASVLKLARALVDQPTLTAKEAHAVWTSCPTPEVEEDAPGWLCT